MNKKITLVALMVFALFYTGVFADQEAAAPEKDKSGPSAKPHEFVTHHKLTIGKDLLSYTAVAGEIMLTDADGTQQASIFSISYTLDGASPTERPLTFVFNGGPGSSAVWLHLGGLGPKRINFPEDPVMAGGPPYQLVDNPNTLLRYS